MKAKIKNRILERNKIENSKPLPLAEILEAAKSLEKEKSPGLEGIHVEFYQ